jgi:hypothetical protein
MQSATELVNTSSAHMAAHTLHVWRSQLTHTLISHVWVHAATRKHQHHLLSSSLLALRGNVEACKSLRQRETVLRMRPCKHAMHAWRAAVADSRSRILCAARLGDARKQRQETQLLQLCLHGLRRWAATQRACSTHLCKV